MSDRSSAFQLQVVGWLVASHGVTVRQMRCGDGSAGLYSASLFHFFTSLLRPLHFYVHFTSTSTSLQLNINLRGSRIDLDTLGSQCVFFLSNLSCVNAVLLDLNPTTQQSV
jgi:hypothetical protein